MINKHWSIETRVKLFAVAIKHFVPTKLHLCRIVSENVRPLLSCWRLIICLKNVGEIYIITIQVLNELPFVSQICECGMFVLLFLLGVITALIAWVKWNYGYWERRKVPGPEPTLFGGNFGPTLILKEHAAILFERWYRYRNVLSQAHLTGIEMAFTSKAIPQRAVRRVL